MSTITYAFSVKDLEEVALERLIRASLVSDRADYRVEWTLDSAKRPRLTLTFMSGAATEVPHTQD